MDHLLQEHLGTVLQPRLVSFAKDWVQRFVEKMSRIYVAQCVAHDKFHSFERVFCQGGSIQKHWGVDCLLGHSKQDRVWRHSLDRERHFVKFEFSR